MSVPPSAVQAAASSNAENFSYKILRCQARVPLKCVFCAGAARSGALRREGGDGLLRRVEPVFRLGQQTAHRGEAPAPEGGLRLHVARRVAEEDRRRRADASAEDFEPLGRRLFYAVVAVDYEFVGEVFPAEALLREPPLVCVAPRVYRDGQAELVPAARQRGQSL